MSIQETIKKYLPDSTTLEMCNNLVLFEVEPEKLAEVCTDFHVRHNLPLKTVVALDERSEKGGFRIMYIFGVREKNVFIAPSLVLKDGVEFPSMTSVLPEVAFYEREIKEFFGLQPIGHPSSGRWLLHNNWPEGVYPLRKDFAWNERPEEIQKENEFAKLQGEGVFEIPVGPVHAGIIEPGHFRFGMAGEEIISLEPRLGYVHKGVEKLFEILPLEKKITLSEHVSGDTAFTHSLAFCGALESLAGVTVPARAQYLRVIFSELERLANHIGDVGLILLGTAFNFGSSQGARLREEVLQVHERLTDSRFLRGVNTIGGVTKDISNEHQAHLTQELDRIEKEFRGMMSVVDKSLIIANRLSGTGTLSM
ncbi:MAG: NADH-quinone oxidoreductase subunit C, partial [Patescibacteria group bacterium]